MRIRGWVELSRGKARGQRAFSNCRNLRFPGYFHWPRIISMHSSMGSMVQKSAVYHWLDLSAGLAYITVGVRFNAFRHFLDAIDTLIANPAWQPGTPVLEDLRDCEWTPPPPAIE